MGQPRLVNDDKSANLATLTGLAIDAAGRGAEVLVLPECPMVGWLSPATPEAAEPIPGPFTDMLGELAARLELTIVSGVEERAGDALYNSAVLIGPESSLRLHHRKIDELPIGRDLFRTGDRLGVCRLDGRTVGVDICADSWGDDVVGTLAMMGAGVIFTPCAWAIAPGEEQANVNWLTERYLTLARRHSLIFVAANSVGNVDGGPWKGRVLHGDSLVVGPDGVLAQGKRNKPDLVLADLPDLSQPP